MQKQLDQLQQELEIREYSSKTIRTYLNCVKQYFSHKKTNLTSFNLKHLKQFLLFSKRKGLSARSRNLSLNAIKFYYRHVVKIQQKIPIKSAKEPRNLPVILNKMEIKNLIDSTKNYKYKLIFALTYGAGLRLSEVTNLKIQDLNFAELSIHLKKTKGNKDRITLLPSKLKPDLETFISGKNQASFVFPSQRGGKLSERSIQKLFKQSLKAAKIKKKVTFHSLRHGFATHLLDNGVNIRSIQKLMGHQDIRTTQRYTRVSNLMIKKIKSPY